MNIQKLTIDKQLEAMIHNWYEIGENAQPQPWMNVLKDLIKQDYLFTVPIETPSLFSKEQIEGLMNHPEEFLNKPITTDHEVKIEFKRIYPSKNTSNYYIPIFTNQEAMKKLNPVSSYTFTFTALMNIINQNDKILGFVLNPLTEDLILNKNYIEIFNNYPIRSYIEFGNCEKGHLQGDAISINDEATQDKNHTDLLNKIHTAYLNQCLSIVLDITLFSEEKEIKKKEARVFIDNIAYLLHDYETDKKQENFQYMNIFINCIKEKDYLAFREMLSEIDDKK